MKELSYKQRFDLSGKTAVVTGGAGLLGRHFCAGLAESGAAVAVVDLREQPAIELAQALSQQYGVRAIGIGCDVSVPQSVQAMVGQVVREFGEIHILHNNAAGKSDDLDAFFAAFEDYSHEQWRKIMGVNLDGMFLVAQAVGKQMVAQGKGGSIIQTSSIYGVMAPDHRIYEGVTSPKGDPGGFSEDAAPPYVSDFMNAPEGHQLMKAFMSIKSAKVRRSIIQLAISLAADEQTSERSS